MQLSHASSKDTIIARTYFKSFGDSLDHSTAYPLADVVANANRWVQKVSLWCWKASYLWNVDDTNQTTLAEPTTTLVASQRDYSLPAGTVGVKGVSVKDAGGIWHPLTEIDETEMNVDDAEFEKNDGLPWAYRLVGNNTLKIYPAASAAACTLTAGLKVYIDREFTTFTVPVSYTTADTTEPGFDEMFHEIIPLGCAYEWCLSNGPTDRASALRSEIEQSKQELYAFFQEKSERKPRINPKRESII